MLSKKLLSLNVKKASSKYKTVYENALKKLEKIRDFGLEDVMSK
jgi:hypothetical protein